MRNLVRILFRPTAFEGLRKIILFLTSISTVELKKKIILIVGTNSRKLFWEYLIEDASSNVNKICVKSIGYLMWFS